MPSKPNQTGEVAAPEAGARTDARLGQLVRLLADHPMLVMSGTKLADELGTNRGLASGRAVA
jgi:hypothetical protein